MSVAYVNLQQGYTKLMREGNTKTKEHENKDLQLLALTISVEILLANQATNI